ncbi:MAG: putative addiction module antidote protein family [Planctomycetota bacterium]|nr:putative addiction module antidote protein family [Planctomycetota bacterium]
MDSLTVELPKGMRQFLESEAAERGLGTAEAYLVELARQEQMRKAKARLEAHLLAGLESGPAIPVTPEFWAGLRQGFEERQTKREGQ